ncbi:MAG: hypothetical protein DMF00_05895 [Verrucomicrobia bacterium]|nr:MAG: hypothetical protein DMF00_05895 [Verrucomicrobiota bacterium]
MYSLIQHKTLVCGRAFLLLPLILVSLVVLPQMQAAPQVLPTPIPGNPDGCYPGFTTAEGCKALHNLTSGAGNTGVGWYSLFGTSTGNFSTGIGAGTLVLNNGDSNTAGGAAALLLNIGGTRNTAFGTDALVYNGNGVAGANFNDAFGAFALFNNSDGFSNNAVGDSALIENLHGAANTAVGDLALSNNDSTGSKLGNVNTAVGGEALFNNTDGDSNNAVGFQAMDANTVGVQNNAMGVLALSSNADGASNTALGDSALAGNASGSFNTVVGWSAGDTVEGDDNIYIGATAADGVTSESGTIRIGDPNFVGAAYMAGIFGVPVVGAPVIVAADGQLGVGVAGSPLSANELTKTHRVVQQLKVTTEKQAARIALQEGEINALTAALRQQADQIQKVSAQLEMIRPTPRVVGNR